MSHTTVSVTLLGTRLTRWRTLRSIAGALGATDEDEVLLRRLWDEANEDEVDSVVDSLTRARNAINDALAELRRAGYR